MARADYLERSCDVLVVGAFHPELAPLQPLLGAAMRGSVGNLRVSACVVGIGLPMAAVGAALRVVEAAPRAVVLVGTCGAYPGCGLAVGQATVARRVRLVDPSALRGSTEFPEPMSLVHETDSALTAGIAARAGARPVDVATTLAVTVDDDTAAGIARSTGAHVEHLEALGVAAACAARGVPFTAVLAIANGVGSAARLEWRQNHRSAAQSATDAVVRWLRDAPRSGPLAALT